MTTPTISAPAPLRGRYRPRHALRKPEIDSPAVTVLPVTHIPSISRESLSIQRFKAIDGLRGIAIISVLLYHAGWSSLGQFGVDAFFVLSGFLISLLLLQELRHSGRIKIGRFYAQRARRILPPLVVTLGATLILLWMHGKLSELQSAATTAILTLAQIANWQQPGSGSVYWAESGTIVPLGQMWSLSITEQFYLVWPILMLIVWGLSRGRPSFVATLLFMGLIGASFVAPMLFNGANATELYLRTDSRAVCFTAGAAFAALVHWAIERNPRWVGSTPSRGSRFVVTALSATSLIAIVVVSVATSSYYEAWHYRGGIAIVRRDSSKRSGNSHACLTYLCPREISGYLTE